MVPSRLEDDYGGQPRLYLETSLQLDVQLTKDLHPVFTYAVSRAGNDGCKPFIRARLAELGLQLQPLQIPCDLSRVTEEMLKRCSRHLNFTLSLLDGLLSDDILSHQGRQKIEEQHQVPNRRLIALRDLISFRYKAPWDSAESKNEHKQQAGFFMYEELSSFINFNIGFTKEKGVIEALTQLTVSLNYVLPRISYGSQQMEERTGLSVEDAIQSDDALQKITETQRVCYALDHVMDLVNSRLEYCDSQHAVGIQIAEPFSEEQGLRILLSVCQQSKIKDHWYPIQCHQHQASGVPAPSSDFNLCSCVSKASARYLLLKLAYDSSATWETSAAGRARVDRRDVLSSLVTLSDFLQNDRTIPISVGGHYVRRGERRRLQCLLALGMLYLYRSSWFEGIWDIERIKFSAAQPQFGKPYAFSSLVSGPTTRDDPENASIGDWDPGIFMANFGLLLLQIDCQQLLELSEEERLDEFGIEIALDRYLKELKGDIDDPIAKVLLVCLDFNAFVEQVEHPSITDEDMKQRLIILNKIFAPLKEILALSFPEIAADMPDIIHRHWDPDPLLFKSHRNSHPASHSHVATPPPVIQLPNLPSTLPEIASLPNAEGTENSPNNGNPHIRHLQMEEMPETVQHDEYFEESTVPWKVISRLGLGAHSLIEEVEPTSGTFVGRKQVYVRKLVRNPGSRIFREKCLLELRKEAHIMESLSHHHIVRLHATYTLKNDFAMIMSPKGDANLQEYLENNPRPGPDSPMPQWFGCLASTLAYLHSQRIKHRDIKPANILVKGSRIILADFSISKNMWDDLVSSTSGPVDARTPMYCAPEVADSDPRGRPSDVFSLGCVFLEMATALLWRCGCSVAQLHEQITTEHRRAYHAALDRVLRWIVMLRVMNAPTGTADGAMAPQPFLEWCLYMLLEQPADRISAQDLTAVIGTAGKLAAQCGHGRWMCAACTSARMQWKRIDCRWPPCAEDDVQAGMGPDWKAMKACLSLVD